MRSFVRLLAVAPVIIFLFPSLAGALTSNSQLRSGALQGDAVANSSPDWATNTSNASTVTPNLFTGSFAYPISIQIPPARNGIQPEVAISYRSESGNGWLGTGWSLELGAVERGRAGGVRFDGDAYVLKRAGGASHLTRLANGEYRATIESSFIRVRKLPAGDYDSSGLPRQYFEATDTRGVKFVYGRSMSARQYDSNAPDHIFRWCLERIEDPHGNYATFAYVLDRGAIYPDRIDYGGASGHAPTAYVKFYGESRTVYREPTTQVVQVDTPVSYDTGFSVKMQYRLRTIDVWANGARVTAYGLKYSPNSDPSGGPYTRRSLLRSIQRFGADAYVDWDGSVTSGTSLPASKFDYHAGGTTGSSYVAGPQRWVGGILWVDIWRLMVGDFNGDGRADIAAFEGINQYAPMSIYISNGNGFNAPIAGPVLWAPGDNDGLIDVEARFKLGDFNGDGRTDIAIVNGWDQALPMSIYFATSSGSFLPPVDGPVRWVGGAHDSVRIDSGRLMVGDFNGDGMDDLVALEGINQTAPMSVFIANGAGFNSPLPGPFIATPGDWAGLYDSLARFKLGDFNGDGRMDIGYVNGWDQSAPMSMFVANADGSFQPYPSFNGPTRWVGGAHDSVRIDAGRVMVGDFNGDGKTDLAAVEGINQTLPMTIYLSFGSGFNGYSSGPSVYAGDSWDALYSTLARFKLGDYNGDGRTDIGILEGWAQSLPMGLYLSTAAITQGANPEGMIGFVRANGPVRWVGNNQNGFRIDCARELVLDFNGDGKDDIAAIEGASSAPPMSLYPSPAVPTDLLSTVDNGQGTTTAIAYTPSTTWGNRRLPFAIQTLLSMQTRVTTAGGSATTATTTFYYNGGYMHAAERDFRGFAYAQVTSPAGADGEKVISQTWFLQGNGVQTQNELGQHSLTGPDDPSAATGYMKGKPWMSRVMDASNTTKNKETVTAYWPDSAGVGPWVDADGVAPWFTPIQRVSASTYQGGVAVVQRRTDYQEYDDYGNVERELRYGDLSKTSDDVTIVRTFLPNVTDWIVSLPATEGVYHDSRRFAGKSFFYDGIPTADPMASDSARAAICGWSSIGSIPVKGDLTRVVSWNCYAADGSANCTEGTHPEARFGYDMLGNVVCSRSPKGGISTTSYDSTASYPTVSKDALGHATAFSFYGIDWVQQDTGLFGQVKTVTDPNGAVTTTYYDKLGREVRKTAPGATRSDGNGLDLAVFTWSYGTYDSDGHQYVRKEIHSKPGPVTADTPLDSSSLVTWKEIYFDGLGRTIRERAPGADAKIVVKTTTRDARGAVSSESLPYFEAGETPRYVTSRYDAFGRVTSVTNPRGTATYCHLGGTSVRIDELQHRRRVTRDAEGLLVKVEEYLGTYPSCTTDQGSPYATTTYDYNPQGKLTFVTDAKGNKTEYRYDSLGRERYIHDPDFGETEYRYDEDGNLVWQQDAKLRSSGKEISFQYDLLGRLTVKTYPNGATIINDYDANFDDSGVPSASIGRLTRTADSSGYETYRYDAAGKVTRYLRNLGRDGTYAFESSHDALGAETGLKYPSGETVPYVYDNARNLISAGSYATFAGFNALGMPRTITYGNQVKTTYSYYDTTDSRVNTILVESPLDVDGPGTGIRRYLSLSHAYDSVGNVSSIADLLNQTRSQTFWYDELDRLTRAQSTVYGDLSFGYDAVGNITSKEGISFNYPTTPHSLAGATGDRPNAIVTTSSGRTFQYDLNGNTTSDGVRTMDFDFDNRPASITLGRATTSYAYDSRGHRLKKSTKNGDTVYVGKLLECTRNACGVFIYAGERRIALKTGSDIKYYQQNHLDSTALVTSSAGKILEEIAYDPYGKVISDAGSVSMNHKYTGQELDPESGLYYYGARYYDQEIGRFVSPDSVLASFTDPQTLNRYAYVRNNPLKYVDPEGEFFMFPFALAVATWDLVSSTLYNIGYAIGHGGFDITSGSSMRHAWEDFGQRERAPLSAFDPTKPGTVLNNELMLDLGLMMSAPWEYVQSVIGYTIAGVANINHQVERVSRFKRSVVVDYKNGRLFCYSFGRSAFTLGTYINVGQEEIDTLRHEYGHVQQSLILGPFYLPIIAGPSLISAGTNSGDHDYFWTEVWANQLGEPNSKPNDSYPRSYRFTWMQFWTTAPFVLMFL